MRQVWQPGEAFGTTPRVFSWGVCGSKLVPNAEPGSAHAKGHAPAKCSGVLLLALAELDDVASENSRKRDARPDEF